MLDHNVTLFETLAALISVLTVHDLQFLYVRESLCIGYRAP